MIAKPLVPQKHCLFCRQPIGPDRYCACCDLFSPRTTMERADMLTRHARFRGMLIPHGPHSCLIDSRAAALIAEVDFDAWRAGVNEREEAA